MDYELEKFMGKIKPRELRRMADRSILPEFRLGAKKELKRRGLEVAQPRKKLNPFDIWRF